MPSTLKLILGALLEVPAVIEILGDTDTYAGAVEDPYPIRAVFASPLAILAKLSIPVMFAALPLYAVADNVPSFIVSILVLGLYVKVLVFLAPSVKGLLFALSENNNS